MEERNIQKITNLLMRLAEETLKCPVHVELCKNTFLFRYVDKGSTVELKIHNADELVKCMTVGTAQEWMREMEKIREMLKAAGATGIRFERIKKGRYEEIRNFLIMRPLNYKIVKADLQEIPHLVLGDITLVLYAVMAQHGGDYHTAKVPRDMMREWNVSEEDAIRNALQNTQALYPARLFTVEDLLNWGADIRPTEDFQKIRKGSRSYILTNSLEINGAVALFYPDVAKRIAQALESDFYIACTSIHEAQIHSVDMISPDLIRSSLHDTNKHCNGREEVLTYSVYRYGRKNGRFSRMVNGEFRDEVCWMITPSGKVRFDLEK